MKFHLGAEVVDFEGEKLGSLKQIVVDPVTQEITSLIIDQGLLFKEDKVLPISLVLQAEEDQIRLVETDQDLAELPPYQEESYFPYQYQEKKRPPTLIPGNYLAIRPDTDYGKPQEHLAVFEQKTPGKNLPEPMDRLKKGADVISLDGNKVGQVQEVMAVPETKHITHLIIDRGFLNRESVLIPIDWVDEISAEKLSLQVDQQVIDHLPPHLREDEPLS